jgi:hypothetical protein
VADACGEHGIWCTIIISQLTSDKYVMLYLPVLCLLKAKSTGAPCCGVEHEAGRSAELGGHVATAGSEEQLQFSFRRYERCSDTFATLCIKQQRMPGVSPKWLGTVWELPFT